MPGRPASARAGLAAHTAASKAALRAPPTDRPQAIKPPGFPANAAQPPQTRYTVHPYSSPEIQHHAPSRATPDNVATSQWRSRQRQQRRSARRGQRRAAGLSATRSSANWAARPGSFDSLHTAQTFPSRSAFGIPELRPQTFDLPPDVRLRPYRSRLDRLDPARDLCHFYLDDYRFEAVWNRPAPGARHVAGYFATCSPDFSLYPDWPLAAQIWNTYRSRWLARYWQAGGLRVIPTLNWSDAASFAFCFDGIPPGQILTIAVADLRRPHVERRFRAGLEAMLARLRPRLLLVYGRLPEDPGCPVLEVPPDWECWRARP